MKALLSTTALVMVLAAPSAVQAQMQPTEPQAQVQQQAPEGPLAPDAGAPVAAPFDSATTPQTLPDATADATSGAELFLASQQADHLLASEIFGVTIVDPAGNELGDVNDIVFDANNEIIAVVVGVGGFLGIGEKIVAVSFDRLSIEPDGDSGHRIVMDTTFEELEAAPDFVTLAAAKDAAERNLMQQQMNQPSAVPSAPAPAEPARSEAAPAQ